jgi:hypothetical protein
MKKQLICLTFLTVSSVVLCAQDKPRVFVQGKGSQDVTSSGSETGGRHWGAWGSSSTMDAHDEGMEVTKNLQKDCTGIIVTLNQSNADYTVMLNRESKKNRGLLRSNSQVQVANHDGDILGTSATHTVGNASKDACQLIIADWQTHGRAPAAAAQPAGNPGVLKPAGSQMDAPQQPAQLVTISAPTAQTEVAPAAAEPASTQSLGDAAKRAKLHAACLELAKDNPSVTCK